MNWIERQYPALPSQPLFEEIQSEFGHFQSVADPVTLTFEVQQGLPFKVCLYLVDDELCLQVGEAFWNEWFPASDPRVVAAFREISRGVLSGKVRLVEFRRNDHIIKAHLEEQRGGTWKKVAGWSRLRLPSRSQVETLILQARRA